MVGVAPLPSLETLNELPGDQFAETVGPLFERAPHFLARLAQARPFASFDALFDRALSIARAMPEADQLELIDGHPRLGSDPAVVRARSELSWREQGYDRAESAEDVRVASELQALNDAYERRFGFRFVVFVAGRSRAELLGLVREALARDRSAEIRRALGDVVSIARARWEKSDSEGPGR